MLTALNDNFLSEKKKKFSATFSDMLLRCVFLE